MSSLDLRDIDSHFQDEVGPLLMSVRESETLIHAAVRTRAFPFVGRHGVENPVGLAELAWSVEPEDGFETGPAMSFAEPLPEHTRSEEHVIIRSQKRDTNRQKDR